MRIVICGGGVIGAAIAYFLARRGAAVTLVERSRVACAASGKSGGFLALDWCDHSPLRPLARAGFGLHAELARSLGRDYGYRSVETFLVSASERRIAAGNGVAERPQWVDEACGVNARIGTCATTAQVHPARFTEALVESAVSHGALLRRGRVEGVELARGGAALRGVRVDGTVMPADAAVIAMGPWSSEAQQWLPLPPVHGLKGYSITMRPEEEIPAQALFVEYETADGDILSPEISPRPDGEVYVCGMAEPDPVPKSPDDVSVDDEACRRLHRAAGFVSPALGRARVVQRQACYRPVCADALPLLGRVPGISGAYVATGHNCWGILNAPASGKAMAELVLDGAAADLDLTPYDPGRAAAR